MTEVLLDENGRPLFPREAHPAYSAAVLAGEPMVHVLVPGLIDRPAVLLQAHLDGSMWVMGWNGSPFLIGAKDASPLPQHGVRATDIDTARRAWETVNVHGLSRGQVKVLIALRDAGEWGLIDHDHEPLNGLEQDSAGKRRGELVKKGLVRARTDFPTKRESPRGSPSQVWQITAAGQQALRPGTVPSITHLAALQAAVGQ